MVKAATKTCSNCHACKPVNLFREKGNQCKTCRAAYSREYRQNKLRRERKLKQCELRRERRQKKEDRKIAAGIAAGAVTKTCRKCLRVKLWPEMYNKNHDQCRMCYHSELRRCREKPSKEMRLVAASEAKKKAQQLAKEIRRLTKENQREADRKKYLENISAQYDEEDKIGDAMAEYDAKQRRLAIKREKRKNNGAYYRNYDRSRRRNDPVFRLRCALRTRMNSAVKAAGLGKKCDSTSELLGISYQGLKEWLEAQFTEGMTWENRSDWHVDHRVPCDAFDMSDETNQRICFWYKNLQPLWATQNIQKSNTYTEEDKQALISAYCNQ